MKEIGGGKSGREVGERVEERWGRKVKEIGGGKSGREVGERVEEKWGR